MADITMCTGDNCPVKNICYRHTAPVNTLWQAYFIEPPINLKEEYCEEFIIDNYSILPILDFIKNNGLKLTETGYPTKEAFKEYFKYLKTKANDSSKK